MSKNILLIPGDGIGPEVVGVAKKIIDFFAEPTTYLSHSGVCHEAREQVKKVLL